MQLILYGENKELTIIKVNLFFGFASQAACKKAEYKPDNQTDLYIFNGKANYNTNNDEH